MKFNKIFLMFGMAAVGILSSCSDDNSYTPGAETGKYNIAFTSASQNNKTLNITDSVFTIEVQRNASDAGDALTVPLINHSSSELIVPGSVTFDAGATTAEIKIRIAEAAKAFIYYNVLISLPEKYTNQYAKVDDATVYPRVQFTVHKEDWKPYAEGTYKSFLEDNPWERTMEYSEYLGIYRLPDLYKEGYHFYFKWDGTTDKDSEVVVTDNSGEKNEAATVTGYVEPDFGMISSTYTASEGFTGYKVSDGMFHFNLKFTVSAGSFGVMDETYKITKKL